MRLLGIDMMKMIRSKTNTDLSRNACGMYIFAVLCGVEFSRMGLFIGLGHSNSYTAHYVV